MRNPDDRQRNVEIRSCEAHSMSSTLTAALLVNVAVLATTLVTDYGTRALSKGRLVRPLILTLVIVPLFVHQLYSGGTALAVQLGATAVGVLIGLVAVSQIKVHRAPAGGLQTRAGLPYAAVWIVMALARSVFSYEATNWYGPDLGRFLFERGIAPTDIQGVITNGLVLMAVAAVLTRTSGLSLRVKSLGGFARPDAELAN
jgi:hypothetical protein